MTTQKLHPVWLVVESHPLGLGVTEFGIFLVSIGKTAVNSIDGEKNFWRRLLKGGLTH